MKNILMILMSMLLIVGGATTVGAVDDSCANGQGTIYKGINGKTYCRSKIAMNWWSGHAWCDSAQGFSRMIEINEDCDCTGIEGCDTTVSCPNLKGVNTGWWANTSAGDGRNYVVQSLSGQLSSAYRVERYSVICK